MVSPCFVYTFNNGSHVGNFLFVVQRKKISFRKQKHKIQRHGRLGNNSLFPTVVLVTADLIIVEIC